MSEGWGRRGKEEGRRKKQEALSQYLKLDSVLQRPRLLPELHNGFGVVDPQLHISRLIGQPVQEGVACC